MRAIRWLARICPHGIRRQQRLKGNENARVRLYVRPVWPVYGHAADGGMRRGASVPGLRGRRGTGLADRAAPRRHVAAASRRLCDQRTQRSSSTGVIARFRLRLLRLFKREFRQGQGGCKKLSGQTAVDDFALKGPCPDKSRDCSSHYRIDSGTPISSRAFTPTSAN